MRLTAAQTDRAAGVLLGLACGDALGAGYEFGPALDEATAVAMTGGGRFNWAPGEWTDDTSMAVAIADLAASGADLSDEATQDALVARWAAWIREAKDVGVQTSIVLGAVAGDPTAVAAREAARRHHERTGRSGGNGSLMRTAPVAVAVLGRPADEIAAAARAISELTHFDPEAGDACVLLCLAIDHTVRTGDLDLRIGLDQIPESRRATWQERIDAAETMRPRDFTRNGWVVEALQAAWSAITTTDVPPHEPAEASFECLHLQRALEAAVRGGNDTDTVAAIAGALLGARWGRSAVPAAWWRRLHGWPGLRARDLVALGLRSTGARAPGVWPNVPRLDYSSWGDTSVVAPAPNGQPLLVAGVDAARTLPAGVDAVVSLCRLGADEVPAPGVEARDHVEVWLIDTADNVHAEFVLHDAQQAVAALLAEGRTVLLHCVQAHSRTPAVLVLHTARTQDVALAEAMRQVRQVLPDARPNASFRAALAALTGTAEH